MPLPVPKTSRLWMRVLNKDWWDVVLLHFTDAERKQRFRMTGHSFITLLFTRKNSSFRASYVITLFLRHCTCAVLSSFVFQSDQVFTCPLVRITKGINHPLRSDRNFNQNWPIQSDWRVYMWLFYSDCASSQVKSSHLYLYSAFNNTNCDKATAQYQNGKIVSIM